MVADDRFKDLVSQYARQMTIAKLESALEEARKEKERLEFRIYALELAIERRKGAGPKEEEWR